MTAFWSHLAFVSHGGGGADCATPKGDIPRTTCRFDTRTPAHVTGNYLDSHLFDLISAPHAIIAFYLIFVLP